MLAPNRIQLMDISPEFYHIVLLSLFENSRAMKVLKPVVSADIAVYTLEYCAYPVSAFFERTATGITGWWRLLALNNQRFPVKM